MITQKAIVIGRICVGKTSLIRRITTDEFIESEVSTVNASFTTFQPLGRADLQINIWDTPGTERYHATAPAYYHDASVALFVFDRTERESFDEIQRFWLPQFKEHNSIENCLIFLLGNKTDLEYKNEGLEWVDDDAANEWTDPLNIKYFPVSARSGVGISDFLVALLNDLQSESAPVVSIESVLGNTGPDEGKRDNCCGGSA
jgi:small GTP-binding protein